MKLRHLKDLSKRLYWISANQVGIDVIKIVRFIPGVVRYLRDLLRFREHYRGSLRLRPCVHDWAEEGGTTKSEYFWQDLLVARMINKANPQKHVDIGSRVDGFVAHIAAFREIEVFDVRPISATIPGIKFVRLDLMPKNHKMDGYCDSVSCLHALEHFGLGRYGDTINPNGHADGISNLASLLRPRGVLYLSVPIGIERVDFNANRIIDPRKLVVLAKNNNLCLKLLYTFKNGEQSEYRHTNITVLESLALEEYLLGIFVFEKIA